MLSTQVSDSVTAASRGKYAHVNRDSYTDLRQQDDIVKRESRPQSNSQPQNRNRFNSIRIPVHNVSEPGNFSTSLR
jgi:hypothetical protein